MSTNAPLRSTRSPAGLFAALVILPCTLGIAGCMATVEAGPVAISGQEDVTWGGAVPVDVERYPHESYGGRDVYLIGGSWHYRAGNQWATYRREPSELGRRRVQTPRRQPARNERREHR